MSLVFNRRTFGGLQAQDLFGRTRYGGGGRNVSADTALQSSAVWACLRLRADLISTMPVDEFRRINGVQVEVPKPKFLTYPGGDRVHITEWLYSSQVDLDRCGNAFGLITERDGSGLPARVDLIPSSNVTVKGTAGEVTEYRVGTTVYQPRDIWHERQFTLPGLPIGLSPVAYAAYSIGGYLSAQEFALEWFENSAGPGGTLRNTRQDVISQEVAEAAKAKFKAATHDRDIFVTGADWEWTPGTADAAQSAFLEQMKYGVTDICRFFGVPADMIDAEGSSSSITYANVTQRNLQLLVMNLGPAIVRREVALSAALPQPRYVKLNTDAILRMDPSTVTTNLAAQIAARLRTVDEAREVINLAPLTDAQYAEFDRLFPSRAATPAMAQQASAREAMTIAPVVNVTTPEVRVSPEVHLHQESRDVVVPAPQVTVTVEPTPVDVNVTNAVEPAAVFVEVAPTEVTVDAPSVTVEAPVVNLSTPARKSETVVKRDPKTGLITETTTTEKDA